MIELNDEILLFFSLDYDFLSKNINNLDLTVPEFFHMVKKSGLENILTKQKQIASEYYETELSFYIKGPEKSGNILFNGRDSLTPIHLIADVYVKEITTPFLDVYAKSPKTLTDENLLLIYDRILEFLRDNPDKDIRLSDLLLVEVNLPLYKYKPLVYTTIKKNRIQAGHIDFATRFLKKTKYATLLDFIKTPKEISKDIHENKLLNTYEGNSYYISPLEYKIGEKQIIFINQLIDEGYLPKDIYDILDDFIRSIWTPYFPNLSKDLIKESYVSYYKNMSSLSKYTLYFDGLINGALRSQKPMAMFTYKLIASIMEAIDSTELIEHPYTLYRGLPLEHAGKTDLAFTSKADSFWSAEMFVQDTDPTVMVVYYPAGTKQISMTEATKIYSEGEFLTFPGEEYEFVGEATKHGVKLLEYNHVGYVPVLENITVDPNIDADIEKRMEPLFELLFKTRFRNFSVLVYNEKGEKRITKHQLTGSFSFDKTLKSGEPINKDHLYDLMFGYCILNDKVEVIVIPEDSNLTDVEITDILNDDVDSEDSIRLTL